ncbi:FG-GAP repeat domain-containing protein [Planctomycetota bacterium]
MRSNRISMFCRIGLAAAWALGYFSGPCYAIINAGLQPYDLYSTRYEHVLILTINQADAPGAFVDCTVDKVLKGKIEPGRLVRLNFIDSMKALTTRTIESGGLAPSRPIVVFAGRKRKPKDIMIYADSFYLGQMTTDQTWTLTKSSEVMSGIGGDSVNSLAGIWNGSTEQLVEMVLDMAGGDDFFPRRAYASFQPDILLDNLPTRINGLALYDLESDGDEDIIVCSDQGDRVYLQNTPMTFVNATEKLKLNSQSPSCSVADVDSDNLADILAGAVLYQARFTDNQFYYEKKDILPPDLQSNLKSAAFVELNADGLPDIIASMTGGGLRAFVNQSTKESVSFVEATDTMGLSRPECGAQQDGYFAVGDWNGDLRTDLFYAAERGFFLIQNDQGVFTPLTHDIQFKFTSGHTGQAGKTGAGVFLPLLGPERMDLIVPIEDGWIVVTNQDGKPVDITQWGNEISEGANDHLASIASDLNLDGHVDFYTICDTANGHNRYIINRGYGSFMLADSHKHYNRLFEGPAAQLGGSAVAAGDINNDGAPDLVIGNDQGRLSIILNDILAARKPIAHPTREIATLQDTRVLVVRVLGSKGIVNARVKLTDASGKLITRWDLGQNIASGCCGPNKVCIAIRKPDHYTVSVEYSDGLIRSQNVDLKAQAHLLINIDRGEEQKDDVW